MGGGKRSCGVNGPGRRGGARVDGHGAGGEGVNGPVG